MRADRAIWAVVVVAKAASAVTFKAGDRVYVTDQALHTMREIMAAATGKEPQPNHRGTVAEVWDDGTILINFDEDGVEGAGNAAPYPPAEVRPLRVPV